MSTLNWNTYRQQLTVRIGEIAEFSPDTIKGYRALTAAARPKTVPQAFKVMFFVTDMFIIIFLSLFGGSWCR